jgi:hypothetical protein
MTGPRTPEEKTGVLDRLRRWKFGKTGLLAAGSNYVFLSRLLPPDQAEAPVGPDTPFLAIYKPAAGERPLHDFPYGTLHLRERAAFLVADALGWPLLPPVVVRDDAPHGPGSVQLFIDHDPAENFFTLRDSCLSEFAPVAAFDVLVQNADRKGGALLRGKDGRIWAIDNALTFNPYARRRTVMFEFSGEPYPPGTSEAVRKLALELEPGRALGDELRELLDKAEVAALADRASRLADSGVHPRLDPERNVPWPFV